MTLILRSRAQVFYRMSLNPGLEEEGHRGDMPLSFSGALTTGDVNLGDPAEFLHGSTSLSAPFHTLLAEASP